MKDALKNVRKKIFSTVCSWLPLTLVNDKLDKSLYLSFLRKIRKQYPGFQHVGAVVSAAVKHVALLNRKRVSDSKILLMDQPENKISKRVILPLRKPRVVTQVQPVGSRVEKSRVEFSHKLTPRKQAFVAKQHGSPFLDNAHLKMRSGSSDKEENKSFLKPIHSYRNDADLMKIVRRGVQSATSKVESKIVKNVYTTINTAAAGIILAAENLADKLFLESWTLMYRSHLATWSRTASGNTVWGKFGSEKPRVAFFCLWLSKCTQQQLKTVVISDWPAAWQPEILSFFSKSDILKVRSEFIESTTGRKTGAASFLLGADLVRDFSGDWESWWRSPLEAFLIERTGQLVPVVIPPMTQPHIPPRPKVPPPLPARISSGPPPLPPYNG